MCHACRGTRLVTDPTGTVHARGSEVKIRDCCTASRGPSTLCLGIAQGFGAVLKTSRRVAKLSSTGTARRIRRVPCRASAALRPWRCNGRQPGCSWGHAGPHRGTGPPRWGVTSSRWQARQAEEGCASSSVHSKTEAYSQSARMDGGIGTARMPPPSRLAAKIRTSSHSRIRSSPRATR